MSIASKVRVPKTAELVANHLRDQILRNELPESEILPNEVEMIQTYKVSRPTLREAYRILEAEGLLSISRGTRGARVQLPNINVVSRRLSAVLQARSIKLDDVYRARTLVEPPAARLVAERGKAADVDVLRHLIERARESLNNHADFGMASNQFHRKLVQLSGVQTLGLIIDMLNEMLERHMLSVYMAGVESSDGTISLASRRKAIRAQEKLVSLIEAGESDKAETFWRKHLNAVDKTLEKLELIEDVHMEAL